ncbi:glycoside hydrolase family 3 protein [Alicyclobacillus acidoterrestris]|uniref:Glycoside hydrolase family 3 C-terminal domain-containing protein n=1 Tax=Alicyclobacillus acidoterrestris (strain ATCC 49025 / DSM 3922 / CIP 106132 / NCIMB 13137 / GD3B) TaxID=1356854 RepID=T0BNM8_ALIAG|nr:glycoside hydrolase family 3 protein [Alicyclobacillus acidoterrestris]EPZ42364.1 beta-glucosidase [Alicyclobacillus acidoterrestris ATCC 49025]UNO50492.1 glycoside hydrolase family 3 C-terminal domain-containing protein [Alicyclobacillus acidoterrestris]
MSHYMLDWNQYRALARTAIAEGAVLLRNEHDTLPIKAGSTVSVFGRNQFAYYKSGTGSGGMVNVTHVTTPLDALQRCDEIRLNGELLQVYEAWLEENPFDKGTGWAGEPWSQKEMPVSDEIVLQAAAKSDLALIMIGRTAGEDRDNSADPGSYLLTDTERDMLHKVCRAFEKTVVVLNVGNIIDMQWVSEFHPSAVLYAWQGGMEGGEGLVDVLTGKVAPSGKLADTIAQSIDDYPSTANFGYEDKAIYQEDIYVGYRYFETFAKDKVLYPFGFGLSYTTFQTEVAQASESDGLIEISFKVTNIGSVPGKEVVQIYVEKPQGLLGNPARSLIAFAKTSTIEAGESEVLTYSIPVGDLACYDDGGVTGNKSCYVLESGTYRIYAGTDVRSATPCFEYQVDALRVISRLSENMAPVTAFTRMKPVSSETGYTVTYEEVPLRTVNSEARRLAERPENREYTGDKGYTLADVYHQKVSLDAFLDQLTDDDLACMVRGEGMNSPKVTPGTAGAFGGVSDRLNAFGIPAACCSDGPSGIRMDCGTTAFSMPNGTLLACTFNLALMEDLYEMTGMELRKNRIDTLLGPGMNIHRNPLNGRNFEYFSEDPLLTGKMAAAQLKGMHRVGVTGTLKHFCANNQEFHRHDLNSIVSERALREIYLKGFEIAVKEAGAYAIMTTYGAVNGVWTAGLYDQNTRILRDEWGFQGVVMTDWWAKINDEGGAPSRNNTAAMIRAQNDLYMVVEQPDANPMDDNTSSSLADGSLTRGELLRCAANVCRFIMRSPVMERALGVKERSVEVVGLDEVNDEELDFDMPYQPIVDGGQISLENIDTSTGSSHVFAVALEEPGKYEVTITARSSAGELAQMPVTLLQNNVPSTIFTFNGTDGQWVSLTREVFFFNKHAYLKLFFGLSGLEIRDITFKQLQPFHMKDA